MPVDWPPNVSDEQLKALTTLATTYALAHGLLYLPTTTPQPPAPTSAIHAPLSLFPSLIPRRLFEHVQRIQAIYNVLYARVATDEAFLDRVMGAEQGVGQVDDFVGQLWTGWKKIRDDGISQPLHLGIFRSDYLLHAPTPSGAMSFKQVEFNTISSSFGPLSERAAALHRYLLAGTNYFDASPLLKMPSMPANQTTAGVAEGLALAHKTYGTAGARILFVVQDGERNVFDQRWLEYELLERHSICVVRQSMDELASSASIHSQTNALLIAPPTEALEVGRKAFEISVVYFRACYMPTDFPTPTHYSTRFLLERSKAIKCPSIPLQLAGGKKVQEVLTQPGVLEHFLCDSRWSGPQYTEADLAELRESWVGMWGLGDLAKESGLSGLERARAEHAGLVLKPQREGGGNNIYKANIPPFLDSLPERERDAWIAMELIRVPEAMGNYLVRSGTGIEGAVKAEVVSELGIFGYALFGSGVPTGVEENTVGWLLRTKGKDSDEGGVAAGFSVLDSVLLVDD